MSGNPTNGPYCIRSSQTVYENPWISVREDRVTHEKGGEGLFGIVTLKPGSTVLPITDDGRVYLVREHKYGLGASSVEVMSGGIDEGESPLEAAKRELQEELGLAAGEWIDLGVTNPFTTVMDSPNYMFLARDLSRVPTQPDDWEEIEPMCVALADAVQMVLDGQITHAASCISLLKVERMLRQSC